MADEIGGETVIYEIKDHIATITLNRPEKRNAINRPMRREIEQAFKDVKYNDDVWVAIITGNGPVFCAGKDLLEPRKEEDGIVMSNDQVYEFHRNIYKPFICALNGPCYAQGGGFALNSDVIIMAQNASLGWPQVMRGISSVSGPVMAAKNMPWQTAMAHMLRAKPIPADVCHQFGMCNEVVTIDELMPAALRWAEEINGCAPLAVRAIKEAARRGWDMNYREQVYLARDIADRVLHSADAKEGIDAFREKRQPVWKGE